MLIGLISDTHGLVRPEALRALEGAEVILHAGDVGSPLVLPALRKVAPVRAVLGNVDDDRDPDLARQVELVVGAVRVHVSHGHEVGSPTPDNLLARYTADVIVYGHTHRALVQSAGARLVVNPGAAGPRRFDVRPSIALMRMSENGVHVEIVYL